MSRGVNSRILGASLLGVALVAGAFLISRMSTPSDVSDTANAISVVATPAPPRTAISTQDTNTDGIEDWKEPFLTAQPVILNNEETYVRENTLTEQLSVNFMERMLLSKSLGQTSTNNEELVRTTTERAFQAAVTDKRFTRADITVLEDTSNDTVRTYGNAMANLLTINNVPGLRNELLILKDALESGEEKHYAQLKQLAEMYAKNRDGAVSLPVPAPLVDTHLALINAFNSLHNDIISMTEVQSDPVKSLVRLRSYQDNAGLLAEAMANTGKVLAQYPQLFSVNDAAVLFSAFNAVQQ